MRITLWARKLRVIELGLHAHPSYLARHGVPKSLADLAIHPLIGFDRVPPLRRIDRLGIKLSRELFAFRCDSDAGQYAALRAGFGLGLCQLGLARRDGLVRLLADVMLPAGGLDGDARGSAVQPAHSLDSGCR